MSVQFSIKIQSFSALRHWKSDIWGKAISRTVIMIIFVLDSPTFLHLVYSFQHDTDTFGNILQCLVFLFNRNKIRFPLSAHRTCYAPLDHRRPTSPTMRLHPGPTQICWTRLYMPLLNKDLYPRLLLVLRNLNLLDQVLYSWFKIMFKIFWIEHDFNKSFKIVYSKSICNGMIFSFS